jgi:hypothetical protein
MTVPISQESTGQDSSAPAEPEFVAWATEHQREKRLHEAELAQITEHADPDGEGDAIGEQEAWARRQDHEKRLHDSAIAQMKPHGGGRPQAS